MIVVSGVAWRGEAHSHYVTLDVVRWEMKGDIVVPRYDASRMFVDLRIVEVIMSGHHSLTRKC